MPLTKILTMKCMKKMMRKKNCQGRNQVKSRKKMNESMIYHRYHNSIKKIIRSKTVIPIQKLLQFLLSFPLLPRNDSSFPLLFKSIMKINQLFLFRRLSQRISMLMSEHSFPVFLNIFINLILIPDTLRYFLQISR